MSLVKHGMEVLLIMIVTCFFFFFLNFSTVCGSFNQKGSLDFRLNLLLLICLTISWLR